MNIFCYNSETYSLKKEKKEILFVYFFVYLRLRSTKAATMTAIMMTTAAPAISKVSLDIPVPGVGATVGEAFLRISFVKK